MGVVLLVLWKGNEGRGGYTGEGEGLMAVI